MTKQNEQLQLKEQLIQALKSLCKKKPVYRDHIIPIIQQLQDKKKEVKIPNNDYKNVGKLLIILDEFLEEKLDLKPEVKTKRGRF